MKGLMKHLVLAALVVMSGAVSLPAVAQETSHCEITSGKTMQMQNIILTAGKKPPGTLLYSTSKTIDYKCIAVPCGSSCANNLRTTLSQGSKLGTSSPVDNSGGTLFHLLSAAGLTLTLSIQEDGQRLVTVPGDMLNQTKWRVAFGESLPFATRPPTPPGCKVNAESNCSYTRNAKITLELRVAGSYSNTSTVTNVPHTDDVLRIETGASSPDAYTTGWLGISPFSIKILEQNLTTISEITPQVVSLGHFINASEASLTRSGNFSVTVAQNKLAASKQEFKLPLNITFGNGTLLAIDSQHLALKNLDGSENGLQLSIKDRDYVNVNGNGLIKFNQETHMGELTVTDAVATGRYTGHYAIEVSRRRGMEVKTGKFRGDIPVTITYS
ncbi:hypothetical protein FNS94_21365 [Salmonella enterica]|nr:hypothetical protein [Salmonella enterica]